MSERRYGVGYLLKNSTQVLARFVLGYTSLSPSRYIFHFRKAYKIKKFFWKVNGSIVSSVSWLECTVFRAQVTYISSVCCPSLGSVFPVSAAWVCALTGGDGKDVGRAVRGALGLVWCPSRQAFASVFLIASRLVFLFRVRGMGRAAQYGAGHGRLCPRGRHLWILLFVAKNTNIFVWM